MLTNEKLVFPYDRRLLDEEFLSRQAVRGYFAGEGISDSIKTQPYPLKHPAFTTLAGSIPMEKPLPDWWKACIEAAPYPLRYFLPSVTVEEYYAGIVDERRYKLFRTFLPDGAKKQVPQSPKLGAMLADNPYLSYFTQRGTAGTVEVLVHITDKPEDVFYMSNGSGWSSCMATNGSYSSYLKGCMFDPSTSMVYVLDTDKDSLNERSSILARALLRVMHVPGEDAPYIIVDKVYGNDFSVQRELPAVVMNHALENGFNASSVDIRRGNTLRLMGYPSSCPSDWNFGYMDNFSYGLSNTVTVDGKTYTSSTILDAAVRPYEKE